jgi:hypothetical protein
MNHSGMPNLVTDDSKLENLNQGFWQLREASFFIDVTLTDAVTLSSEVAFADDFKHIDANYLYADIAMHELLPSWDEDEFGQLTIRGGKFLVPFLSYNENKPNFKQYLMSQPFTAWNMAPVIGTPIRPHSFGWSDIGMMVNWARPVSDLGLMDFKVAMITGIQSSTDVLDDNTVVIDSPVMMGGGGMGMMTPMFPTVRPRDGLIQNEAGSWSGTDNGHMATAGKLAFRTLKFPLDVGISFYYGKWDPAAKKSLGMYGFHANWISENWTLRGEWVRAKVDQEGGFNPVTAMGPAAINTTTGDYNMDAWYVEGSVIPLRFGANNDRFVRLIARYGGVDTNDKAVFTPFRRKRVTLGAELELFTNARLRFEWQRHRISDFKMAPDPYKSAGGKRHIQMMMFSAIYSF